MPNLRITRSKEAHGRARPGAGDVKCKKHPKHKQSPGVCSLCLIEKLSRIPNTSSSSRGTSARAATGFSSVSSMSSYSCSSTCSSCASPMHRYRYSNEGNGSFALFLSAKNVVLTKSRSLAFVPRMGTNKDSTRGDGNKKEGFWSKLLRPRKKRVEKGLTHSRSMREIDIIAQH